MVSENAGNPSFRLYPLGESAVVAEFGRTIAGEVHTCVLSFAAFLDKHPFEGFIEYVPAFTTLTVYYDPWIVSDGGRTDAFEKIKTMLYRFDPATASTDTTAASLVEIPVCYGGDFGPDLDFVASHTGLSPEEVIILHMERIYLVYMIGFAPGFPYLGGMHPAIAAPRKPTPRPAIPAGSVGIAGKQTGIYPIPTPGGWQLIGRTPFMLFNLSRQSPSLLKAGDQVKFVAITKEEYRLIEKGPGE